MNNDISLAMIYIPQHNQMKSLPFSTNDWWVIKEAVESRWISNTYGNDVGLNAKRKEVINRITEQFPTLDDDYNNAIAQEYLLNHE